MYIIIDGSSMLATNYYGTLPRQMLFAKTEEEKAKYYKDIMQTSFGEYTNGVYTSLKQILKLIKYQKPDGVIVVFDASRHTFRQEIYSEYKGTRAETPHPLKEQFRTLEHILEEIGIPTLYSSEYEADDYAGSVSRVLEKHNKECVLISADKDYYQLVTEKTKLWRLVPSPARPKYEKLYGINWDEYHKEHKIPYDLYEITMNTGLISEKELIHMRPDTFIDYLAMVGDKADNIPGVNKIGPVTAEILLNHYGSMQALYAAIEQADDMGKKELVNEWKGLGVKQNPMNYLLIGKPDGELSRTLAEINCHIPLEEDLEFYRLSINDDKLHEMIDAYEMHSLLEVI